jgi:hypothetical protein
MHRYSEPLISSLCFLGVPRPTPAYTSNLRFRYTQDDVRPHLLEGGMRRWRCASRGILEPPLGDPRPWVANICGIPVLAPGALDALAPRFVDAPMPI